MFRRAFRTSRVALDPAGTPRPLRFSRLSLALVFGLLSSLVVAVPPASAAADGSAKLAQCANGDLAHPVDCVLDAEWVNGNVNESKAHYLEGDSLPYRLVMEGLSLASHTVTIEWDTLKSGKHALDYITTFNRTVDADPCAGITGCGSPTTFPIPLDPVVSAAGVTQIPGLFTLYNGTITAVSGYTLGATDGQTSITITFTAATDSPVLAWAAHIATRADWGTGSSAVAIPGSPYHTRLIALDGSGGNQDRSLSASAVIYPGSITIIKDAAPDSTQDFGFSTTGGLVPATFTLDDDASLASPSATSNTQAFTGLTTFTNYTVTEAAASGWTQSFGVPACSVTSANEGSQSASTPTVTIELKEGENVTCTFTNTRQSGTVTVNKVLVPSSDGGRFDLQIDGASPNVGSTNVGNAGSTGPVTVPTGTHTVGEVAVTGTSLNDYTSSISCTNGASGSGTSLEITVASSAAVVCTITNTRQTGTITVNKVLVPASDGGRFDLRIDGSSPNAGSTNVGNAGTTGAIAFQPGDHTVGEIAHAGTSLGDYTSSISCTNQASAASAGPLTITLASNQNIVCTITNTRQTGTIRVNKVLVPASDGGRFDLRIDGSSPNAGSTNVGNGGTTTAVTVNTGSHTVGEIGHTGTSLDDYTSSISCTNEASAANAGPLTITVLHNQDVVCTITNTRLTGSLTVSKTTNAAGTFTFDVVCTNGLVQVITITTEDSGAQTINGIPTRTSCTVTERSNPLFSKTVLPLGGTVVITIQGQTVAFTNTRITGPLTITKTAIGGTGTFTFDVDCSDNAFDQVVSIEGSGSATITGIPTTTSCTVTERSNPLFTTSVLPANGTVSIDAGGENVAFVNTAKPNGITLDKKVNGGDHATIGDALPVHAADSLTYTVVITNNGQVPLTITAMSDSLYAGLISACPQAVGSVLAVGASITCTYKVVAIGDANNVASVSVVDGLGRTLTASDGTYVDALNPGIAIVKTANPVSISISGPVTYTYVVTNTGDTTLHDILVLDDILGAIGSLSELAPGESVTLAKTVDVNATTPPTNIGTVVGTDVLGQTVSASDDAKITVVLGEVLALPAELPRTGSPLQAQTRAALALIQVGLILTLAGRRRWMVRRAD